jgi:hypothetical protein
MGIEEGEKVQTKGIGNILNKIITENFQILRKRSLSRYRTPKDTTKMKPLHGTQFS